MTTAVDTNVFAALWDPQDSLNTRALSALDAALERGVLVVPAPVFAELLAFPGRTEAFVDSFFRETGVAIDWNLDEKVWRAAGRAFRNHVSRRRKRLEAKPRRILADFLIGAYAAERGYALLTLDAGLYRTAFPALKIVSV